MTEPSHRFYAIVLALVVFFVTWATVAARPWAATDPRLAALAQREQQLRADAKLVKQIVDRRMAAYTIALKQRRAQIAQAKARTVQSAQTVSATSPSVRIVNLPPLTITRTS